MRLNFVFSKTTTIVILISIALFCLGFGIYVWTLADSIATIPQNFETNFYSTNRTSL